VARDFLSKFHPQSDLTPVNFPLSRFTMEQDEIARKAVSVIHFWQIDTGCNADKSLSLLLKLIARRKASGNQYKI
jgi:hypothetical protein